MDTLSANFTALTLIDAELKLFIQTDREMGRYKHRQIVVRGFIDWVATDIVTDQEYVYILSEYTYIKH